MSELRLDTWTMPGADVGPENPLPPLAPAADTHADITMSPDIPEEDQRYLRYGRVTSSLPYLMQDGYTRKLEPTRFRTAVLENEFLRATFLLDVGGRLWSIYHKPSGRELLEVNPVFQPANLAIRNAWFSGGVEWNIGMIGHCVFTCSPLHAARVEGNDGTPVLRMYEWERIRQVPFQIDAYLPDGSEVLFIRPRIVNPRDEEVPMYWWSNMAAPETPETRVVVPADHCYRFAYKGGLAKVPIPLYDGKTDGTYSTNVPNSMDFFFRVPDGGRPFITALDGDGKGLGQTSTDMLKGRKLFVWGHGPGGKRWQTFLAKPGCAYIETQAGLARTQAEHLPMPAKAEWEWLEAYGLIEADPAKVHGDWDDARAEVGARIEDLLPRADMNAEFERTRTVARKAPTEILHGGSGWGKLELMRREAAGEQAFCGAELVFGEDSLSEAQAPWLELLQAGELPPADPGSAPKSYVVQPEWRDLLEKSVAGSENTDWLDWLHVGVMRYQAGERDGAREAWENAQSLAESPWALRNLAVLAREDRDLGRCADLLLTAARLMPSLKPLVIECGRALLAADRAGDWLGFLSSVPEPVRSAGRVVLLEGQAALAEGDLQTVQRILDAAAEIDDLREGEVSLSDLWYGMHERRISIEEGIEIDDELKKRVRREFPPPAEIDFRMHT